MAGILRLYYTLRPLRWNQWWYRAWHPVAKRFSRPIQPAADSKFRERRFPQLLLKWPVPHSFDPVGNAFVFLNRRFRFGDRIDWFYDGEGLLWQFNLQYFEWLYDESLGVEARLETVVDFCANTTPGSTMHAYPGSLRIMAWIWFSTYHGIDDIKMMRRLRQDADWLRRFPEYQLDGNHLFENGIALCTAGAFLHDEHVFQNGERILRAAVTDQLCADGGHCEGSPMYHSLLLWRLLQCVEILRIHRPGAVILNFLENAAGRMLGWLQAMTFSDGTWPAVNDAVAGIAPEPGVLFDAAAALNLSFSESELSDSGYRMIRQEAFELFIDVGGILPAWQPGHAHADTGNFCLHVGGKPVIVDTGCSTYADLQIRSHQRGTLAHNTIAVGKADSSDMWSHFRVGRRCRVLNLQESGTTIRIDYITSGGIQLTRDFYWSENSIVIRDIFPHETADAAAPVHLHPDRIYSEGKIDDLISIEGDGFQRVEIVEKQLAGGFNILLTTACFLHYPVEGIGQTCIRMRI